jgi:hypothetical protein
MNTGIEEDQLPKDKTWERDADIFLSEFHIQKEI